MVKVSQTLIPPLKVSLTRRFATNSGLYHHLKSQITRFEWFYHLRTKSQQILGVANGKCRQARLAFFFAHLRHFDVKVFDTFGYIITRVMMDN